jgi:hypothetical protein
MRMIVMQDLSARTRTCPFNTLPQNEHPFQFHPYPFHLIEV